MHVFLMRHGAAESPVLDDWSRALSDQGRSEVSKSANWIETRGVAIDFAIASPLVRAQQSFEIASETLQPNQSTTSDLLIPSAKLTQTVDMLESHIYPADASRGCLIVSHMPLVSYLLEALTFGQHAFLFATGGVAWIDYEPTANQGMLKDFFFPN